MKYILTIALCCLIYSAGAQEIDTIKVLRNVIDTTGGVIRPTQGKYVLEVRELHNTSEDMIDPYACMNCGYNTYWKHIKYLTIRRHSKPKGWVITEIQTESDQLTNREIDSIYKKDHPIAINNPGDLDTLFISTGGGISTLTETDSSVPFRSIHTTTLFSYSPQPDTSIRWVSDKRHPKRKAKPKIIISKWNVNDWIYEDIDGNPISPRYKVWGLMPFYKP